MLFHTRRTLSAALMSLGLLSGSAASLAETALPGTASRPEPAPRLGTWDIRLSDLRLDRALQRWAQTAGYSFRWDADRYVVIGANARFDGNLEQALEAVLATPGIRASAYPLEACIYSNQPPLIRITRLGDQSDDCL